MSEYFQVTRFGGDDVPLFCHPPRTVESIRKMYPDALAVIEISREAFLALCSRMSRVTMV